VVANVLTEIRQGPAMIQMKMSNAYTIDVASEVYGLLGGALEEKEVWELLRTHHVNAAVEHHTPASQLYNYATPSHILASS